MNPVAARAEKFESMKSVWEFAGCTKQIEKGPEQRIQYEHVIHYLYQRGHDVTPYRRTSSRDIPMFPVEWLENVVAIDRSYGLSRSAGKGSGRLVRMADSDMRLTVEQFVFDTNVNYRKETLDSLEADVHSASELLGLENHEAAILIPNTKEVLSQKEYPYWLLARVARHHKATRRG
jgi:hypothetical protein